MKKNEVISRWQESAKNNFRVAADMMRLKHYNWALFLGQLALEKLLKGLILKKTGQPALPLHDLVKLAESSKLPLKESEQNELIEISRFNIQARYDEIKYKLYKRATKAYAERWMKIIKRYSLWLQKQY